MPAAQTPPFAESKREKPANTDQVAAKEDTTGSPFGGLGMSSNKGPTDINSDTLSFDYTKKTATFTGHVRVTQPNGMLTSDKLRVLYENNMHDIKTAFADGNVRISQGLRWATSDHAVLDQGAQTVTLTGSPVVHDDQDQITGTKVTVHMKTQEFVVDRARAVLFPKNGKQPGANATEGTNPTP
jgi:lipopolysaccharide transport protein LptA